MNYYPHHIGDFRSGTINMSRHSRWIYRDMLDVYYDTESPLPLDLDTLCDMLGVESDEEIKVVQRLLKFKFTLAVDGYRHSRCDQEISAYHARAETAKANGKRGGRPKKPNRNPEKPSGFQSGSDPVATSNPDQTGSEANQEPVTKNQEPIQNTHVGDKSPPCPHQEIIDLYHEHCPTLSAVRVWTDKRKKFLQARWRESPKHQSLDFWSRFFQYVAESPFLLGADGRWQADLEWLVTAGNFVKVIEGKYHREAA